MPTSDVPETRFALTPAGTSIAYQVTGGHHDITVVSVPPMAQNLEVAWSWPAIRRMFEGFGEFCRWIAFDKRGTGMSDRNLDIPRLDERVDELSAVLDHAGVDRCYLMGTSEGGPMALMFAATYPERVQGVILESSAAALVPAASPGAAQEPTGIAAWADRFVAGWGTANSITVDLFAPSLANDAEFQRWHQSYERNAASRDAIGTLLALGVEMDATSVLHHIDCPVLMLHRVGDRVVPVEAARHTARLLRSHGAEVELIEQPGEDHFLYAADLTAALAEIERFTTGRVTDRPPTWSPGQRMIATLGRFALIDGGTVVPHAAWGSKRARTLLKRLIVARGQSVTRDELIELLWSDTADLDRLSARLSVQLSTVRRMLGGGVIADRSSVRLDVDHVAVDIERWFLETDDAAIVAGYVGEFLPEDRYDDWSSGLRDDCLARFGAAARRLAGRSRPIEAIELWRRVLVHEPYDDVVHRSLVATLRAEGRLREARAAYQTYVAAMDDIGVTAWSWAELAG